MSGIRFHVLWIAEDDTDIRIDRKVKLYEFPSVSAHQREGLSDGPLSPWFGLVDPRQMETHDHRVHLDANLFWSVGFYFKHLGTCGVDAWDQELRQIANLGEWTLADPISPPPDQPVSVQVGQRYTGCVVDWRGSYGFLSCTLIPEKVFLHSSQILGNAFMNLDGDPIGISVNFELAKDPEKGRSQAINAKPFL